MLLERGAVGVFIEANEDMFTHDSNGCSKIARTAKHGVERFF